MVEVEVKAEITMEEISFSDVTNIVVNVLWG